MNMHPRTHRAIHAFLAGLFIAAAINSYEGNIVTILHINETVTICDYSDGRQRQQDGADSLTRTLLNLGRIKGDRIECNGIGREGRNTWARSLWARSLIDFFRLGLKLQNKKWNPRVYISW